MAWEIDQRLPPGDWRYTPWIPARLIPTIESELLKMLKDGRGSTAPPPTKGSDVSIPAAHCRQRVGPPEAFRSRRPFLVEVWHAVARQPAAQPQRQQPPFLAGFFAGDFFAAFFATGFLAAFFVTMSFLRPRVRGRSVAAATPNASSAAFATSLGKKTQTILATLAEEHPLSPAKVTSWS